MENEWYRGCRKCLLRDLTEKEYFRNMYVYISNLPEEDRTPEEEYERRLSKRMRPFVKRYVQDLWMFCGDACGDRCEALPGQHPRMVGICLSCKP